MGAGMTKLFSKMLVLDLKQLSSLAQLKNNFLSCGLAANKEGQTNWNASNIKALNRHKKLNDCNAHRAHGRHHFCGTSLTSSAPSAVLAATGDR
jgi:hypothetical protein